jgi:histidinol-phosphate phosphatase family protein
LLPGAAAAVRRLNVAALPVAVATNQPVVARGECDLPTLAAIHGRVDDLLGQGHAFIDAWYFCPHHPDRGFPGEVVALKVDCECRKPKPGMIEAAMAELPAEPAESWLIGDSTSDLLAARNAGLRSLVVRTGYAGCDGKYPLRPDFSAPDLAAAVEFILDQHPRITALVRKLLPAVQHSRVIVVGGPAHSGKSSVASVLAEELRRSGRAAAVISTDGFILPPARRGSEVAGRHDTAALAELAGVVARWKTAAAPVQLAVPVYNRLKRAPEPAVQPLVLEPDACLIVEGVGALLATELVAAACIVVHVECPETTRRARFVRDYLWRGRAEPEILGLWDQRQRDEVIPIPLGALVISLG